MGIVLRQARSEAGKAVRIQRQEQAARLHRNLQDRAAARGILKEMADSDRAIAKWHRIKGRLIPDRPASGTSPVKKCTSRSASLAPLKASVTRPQAASSWVIDSAGFRGVTWQQTYLGRSSPKFRRGAAKDNWDYECRDEAVLRDVDGEPVIISNMGDDWVEIGTAWQCLEDASIRKNAKIQMRVIALFDADASHDEKVAALNHFCTTVLQPLNLPYSACIHEPSQEGDQRNYHAHISFSLRPMRRIEPYGWEVADEVRGELDGKAGVQILRHLWAHSLTEAASRHGREMQYTGLGFGARGLDHEAGEHLGEALTAIARRGQHVAALERNRIKAERNRFRSRMRDLDKKIEALSAVRDAVLTDLKRTIPAPAMRRIVSADVAERVEPALAAAPAIKAMAPLASGSAASASSCFPARRLVAAQPPAPRQILAPPVKQLPLERNVPLLSLVSAEKRAALLRPATASRSAPVGKLVVGQRPSTKPRLTVAAPGILPLPRMAGSPNKIDGPTILATAAGLSSDGRVALSPANYCRDPSQRLFALDTVPRRQLLTEAITEKASDPVIAIGKELLAEMRRWRLEREAIASADLAIDAPAPQKVHPNPPANPPAMAGTRPAAHTVQPPFAMPARRKLRRKPGRPMFYGGEALPLAAREWYEAHPQQAFDPRGAQLNTQDQQIVDRIVALDLYVVAKDTGLGLDKWALAALETDPSWIEQPDIQCELTKIRSAQQEVLRTAHAAYGIGSEAVLASAAALPENLRERLERWSDINGFSEDLRLVQQRDSQHTAAQTHDAGAQHAQSNAGPPTDRQTPLIGR